MDLVLLVIGIITTIINRPSLTLVILFGLLTSYYQLGSNVSVYPIVHNVSDTGLILFLFLICKGFFANKIYEHGEVKKLYKPLIALGLFIIISIIYDIYIGNSFTTILQTKRHWIFLFLAPLLLRSYSPAVLKKTIKIIFYISIAASVILIMNYYFSLGIVDVNMATENVGGSIIRRGAIPTTFCLFYLILLTSGYFKLKKYQLVLFISILSLSIISSMIRSMLIAAIFGVVILLYYQNKIKIKTGLSLLFPILILSIVISNTKGFSARWDDAFKEFQYITSGKDNISVKGNMTFRLIMLQERFEFILNSPERFVFGLGSIKEENFNTTFNTGLISKKSGREGRVTQLDTGDIAWIPLIIRLGIVGTILFLLFWIKTIVVSKQATDKLGYSISSYLVSWFVLSLSGTGIAYGYFWFFILMALSSIRKKYNNNQEKTLIDISNQIRQKQVL